MLLDTHCHLTDPQYGPDLALVLGRARSAGVGGIVCVVSDLDDARSAQSLPGATGGADPSLPQIWSTVGVHPHAASRAPGDMRARLEDLLDSSGRVVAIGECGLDFHYDFSSPAEQRRAFELQLRIATDRGLPAVVHCREAEAEMAAIVREAGEAGVRGVLHCFTGDLPLLDAALDADWLVSFTGLVTFRSFAGTEAVRITPSDRYMLETDGPYMAPIPHRGKRNEPAFLSEIRNRVAELRGVPPDRVERESTETARRFFGLLNGEGG
ncbi:MAG: TatD family deoxyribonuclease [Gemmatimonadetes bacterium]|nr:TatD family deoxyribonuclease [Gemmatimonadota bacterium]